MLHQFELIEREKYHRPSLSYSRYIILHYSIYQKGTNNSGIGRHGLGAEVEDLPIREDPGLGTTTEKL